VTQICIISASEISSRKKLDTDPTIANKLAQTVLLFNIIYFPFGLRLKKSLNSWTETAAPDSLLNWDNFLRGARFISS
jgi:hypothetical protein